MIPLAVMALSACDVLALPTLDLTGTYVDSGVIFPDACGEARTGRVALSIVTSGSEAQHNISMSVTIPELDHSSVGSWTIPGVRPDLGGDIENLGIVTMRHSSRSIIGSVTPNLQCGEDTEQSTSAAAFIAARLR